MYVVGQIFALDTLFVSISQQCFFSHQISTSHKLTASQQLTASQHCFSLTTNQHQSPAKANRTKLLQKKIKERAEHDTIYLRMICL